MHTRKRLYTIVAVAGITAAAITGCSSSSTTTVKPM